TETTAEELDVIQQLKNLEVSTENKAAISDGLDALDEEINLIDTTENINALIPKLRQILSEDYFQISSVFDFEGTSFATLKITHPLIPLNQNPGPDPVAISQEIEREHQDFIGNSTFFSTEEVPGSENSPVLNDLMLDLLKSLNINVLDASKDEKEIKEAFNELYQDLILQPGGQDRIFAFTKLATQQGQFLGQVVLNQHYNTVNLYEEAGHLLVY